MSGKYDDIIDLPHPTSQNHPRMSLHDRAAQFSPFAALTGHHAAITETGRLTDRRIELDESEIARVDAELQHLQELFRTGQRCPLPTSCRTSERAAAATRPSPARSSASTRSLG